MNLSGIYQINLGNGYFYIGSAQNLNSRIRAHKNRLAAQQHHNPKMQAVWNEHQVFDYVVLEICEKSQLLIREQVYLDKHFDDAKNINMALVAGHPMMGRKQSDETKAKIRASLMGKKHSLSRNEKNRISSTGRRLSDEAKEKLRISSTGRRHTPETIKKMSASKTGHTVSAEQRAQQSKIMKENWARKRAA